MVLRWMNDGRAVEVEMEMVKAVVKAGKKKLIEGGPQAHR